MSHTEANVQRVNKVLIIGINTTTQAANALNQVDVFFILDKGMSKQKLLLVSQEICC